MSEKQHKPIRQDYIAKIRYTNNLPPPPLNPKFIQYNTTKPKNNKQEGQNLLASLFRKDNFINLIEAIDDELGMNLNLINNRGFLDDDNDSVINNLPNNEDKTKPVILHPKDRELLRDAGISTIIKTEPGVSFLRRTEYIAERGSLKSESSSRQKSKEPEKLDADAQLKAVEDTFEAARDTLYNLDKLKHPRKKNLKAVSTWQLLPDTSMMDTKFYNVKFIGSASLTRELQTLKQKQGSKFNEKLHQNITDTSILKPITSDDGEWISLFQLNNHNNQHEKLKSHLHSTEREKPINLLDEDDTTIENYDFKYVKNYDMHFDRFDEDDDRKEISIKFVPDEEEQGNSENKHKRRKLAYYYPLNGKIDLRKYRPVANTEINRFLRESTLDGINFKLREPTTNELEKMDTIRSEFDPVEYGGDDDEEDDEEEETGEQSTTATAPKTNGEVDDFEDEE
ncbi:RNA polymerase II-associated [Scheffersomyces coipomensis]|uniref:RNA polymerase II-associated n=1 Tax=Scheffersomyces coipomensis TaxID=1788519 RepID=UPI00315D5A7D